MSTFQENYRKMYEIITKYLDPEKLKSLNIEIDENYFIKFKSSVLPSKMLNDELTIYLQNINLGLFSFFRGYDYNLNRMFKKMNTEDSKNFLSLLDSFYNYKSESLTSLLKNNIQTNTAFNNKLEEVTKNLNNKDYWTIDKCLELVDFFIYDKSNIKILLNFISEYTNETLNFNDIDDQSIYDCISLVMKFNPKIKIYTNLDAVTKILFYCNNSESKFINHIKTMVNSRFSKSTNKMFKVRYSTSQNLINGNTMESVFTELGKTDFKKESNVRFTFKHLVFHLIHLGILLAELSKNYNKSDVMNYLDIKKNGDTEYNILFDKIILRLHGEIETDELIAEIERNKIKIIETIECYMKKLNDKFGLEISLIDINKLKDVNISDKTHLINRIISISNTLMDFLNQGFNIDLRKKKIKTLIKRSG